MVVGAVTIVDIANNCACRICNYCMDNVMRILRTDADHHQAMISRPLGGNVLSLERCSYREATIPDAGIDLKVEIKRYVPRSTIVTVLRWFRRRGMPLPQRLREAGL